MYQNQLNGTTQTLFREKIQNLIDPSCQPKEISPKRKMVVCRRLRRLKVVLQIFELVRTEKLSKFKSLKAFPKPNFPDISTYAIANIQKFHVHLPGFPKFQIMRRLYSYLE